MRMSKFCLEHKPAIARQFRNSSQKYPSLVGLSRKKRRDYICNYEGKKPTTQSGCPITQNVCNTLRVVISRGCSSLSTPISEDHVSPLQQQ
jgi:hypothetical protein